MERKSVLFLISSIERHIAFENTIRYLTEIGFDLFVIVIYDKDTCYLTNWLALQNIPHRHVVHKKKVDYFKNLPEVFGLIRKHRHKILHCHYFDACVYGLFLGSLLGIKKRIYTRQYSTLHHQFYPKGVIIDRLFNQLSTRIVAISEVVKTTLLEKEGVAANKVVYLPYFLNWEDYQTNLSKEDCKAKLGIPEKAFVIGSLALQTELKGIFYLLESFKTISETISEAHLLLANFEGNAKSKVEKFIIVNGLENKVSKVWFESDNAILYKAMDVFVNIPINKDIEAFGLTYLEAMMAKTPMICTLSGIGNEFIVHQQNAWVVDYKNPEEITRGVLELYSYPGLKEQLTENGFRDCLKQFDFQRNKQRLSSIYP